MSNDLKKCWELIEKLEEDNQALAIGLRNVAAELGHKKVNTSLQLERRIKNLENRNKKLESDNKFLKQMILKANHLNKFGLENLLNKQRQLENN
tara:strand:+ start:1488 stop:1769 length:282 start_codon:yes stop_codon:yes gene_type:complete